MLPPREKPASEASMFSCLAQALRMLRMLVELRSAEPGACDAQLLAMRNAQGIVFMTQRKAGLVVSGTLTSGIIICRTPGGWSAPSSVGGAGLGMGLQLGAQSTDIIVSLQTGEAIDNLLSAGKIRLGGDAHYTMPEAMPGVSHGGTSSRAVASGSDGVTAWPVSRHGIFGGISVDGMTLSMRDSDNAAVYGGPVPVGDILGGRVSPPAEALELYAMLNMLLDHPDSVRGMVGHATHTSVGDTAGADAQHKARTMGTGSHARRVDDGATHDERERLNRHRTTFQERRHPEPTVALSPFSNPFDSTVSKERERSAAAEAEALDERRQREAVESECRLELQASQDAVAELRRKVAELTRKLEAERARRRDIEQDRARALTALADAERRLTELQREIDAERRRRLSDEAAVEGRADDLRLELEGERRARSLAEEARLAAQRALDELRTRAAEAAREWDASRERMGRDLKAAQARASTAESATARAAAARSSGAVIVAESQEQLDAERRRSEQLQAELHRLTEVVEAARKDKASAVESKAVLQASLDASLQRVLELERAGAARRLQCASLRRVTMHAQSDMRRMRKVLAETQAQLLELQNRAKMDDADARAVTELRRQVDSAQLEVARVNAALQQERREGLQASEEVQQRLDSLERSLAEEVAKSASLEHELAAVQGTVTAELAEAQRSLTELEAQLSEERKRSTALARELSEAQQQHVDKDAASATSVAPDTTVLPTPPSFPCLPTTIPCMPATSNTNAEAIRFEARAEEASAALQRAQEEAAQAEAELRRRADASERELKVQCDRNASLTEQLGAIQRQMATSIATAAESDDRHSREVEQLRVRAAQAEAAHERTREGASQAEAEWRRQVEELRSTLSSERDGRASLAERLAASEAAAGAARFQSDEDAQSVRALQAMEATLQAKLGALERQLGETREIAARDAAAAQATIALQRERQEAVQALAACRQEVLTLKGELTAEQLKSVALSEQLASAQQAALRMHHHDKLQPQLQRLESNVQGKLDLLEQQLCDARREASKSASQLAMLTNAAVATPSLPAYQAPSPLPPTGVTEAATRGLWWCLGGMDEQIAEAKQRQQEAETALQREAETLQAVRREMAAASVSAQQGLAQEAEKCAALQRELDTMHTAAQVSATEKEALQRELAAVRSDLERSRSDVDQARADAAAGRAALVEAAHSDQAARDVIEAQRRALEEEVGRLEVALRHTEERAAKGHAAAIELASEAQTRIDASMEAARVSSAQAAERLASGLRAELERERELAADAQQKLSLALAEVATMQERGKEEEHRRRHTQADREGLLARLKAAEEAEANERRRREEDVAAEAKRIKAFWEGEAGRRHEAGRLEVQREWRKLEATMQARAAEQKQQSAKQLADVESLLQAARTDAAEAVAHCHTLVAEIRTLEGQLRTAPKPSPAKPVAPRKIAGKGKEKPCSGRPVPAATSLPPSPTPSPDPEPLEATGASNARRRGWEWVEQQQLSGDMLTATKMAQAAVAAAEAVAKSPQSGNPVAVSSKRKTRKGNGETGPKSTADTIIEVDPAVGSNTSRIARVLFS